MKLVLFDIDGTLLHSSGMGRETLIYALNKVFGTAGPIESYNMAGKVDERIVTDLMTGAGIPIDKIKANLTEVYEHMAECGRMTFTPERVRPCLGVMALLEELNTRPGLILGLVTGNAHQTAPLKLHTAGIHPGQFRVGAYGSDAPDRNQLPKLAMHRASERFGHEFCGANTVVIGDTPADIACARAGRATAIAVATGAYSADSLARYQPDHLLPNFTDTQAVLDIIG